MSSAFRTLGDLVASRWAHAGRDEEAFIGVAASALAESQLLTSTTPDDIVSWLVQSEECPPQEVGDFGQPPVNLYVGEGFYIQALFWVDGTTAIHEHAFVGAFGVLHGSSIQSRYQFSPRKQVSDRVVVGDTAFLGSELLSRGSIRPILSSDRLIHALFHLDRPSVSIVIRTRKSSIPRPQYYYVPPFLALNETKLPEKWIIQRQLLESLQHADKVHFWSAAKKIAQNCDPFLLYQILLIAFRHAEDRGNWESLLATASRGNEDWLVEYGIPCLIEEARADQIRHLRSSVHDPTHRFFLALLLNVPSRDEMYDLISERFPDSDPRSLVVRWLGEIFATEQAGFKLGAAWLCLLDRMLENPDFDNSLDFLRTRFKTQNQIEEAKLKDAWDRLRALGILKPLLTPSVAAATAA